MCLCVCHVCMLCVWGGSYSKTVVFSLFTMWILRIKFRNGFGGRYLYRVTILPALRAFTFSLRESLVFFSVCPKNTYNYVERVADKFKYSVSSIKCVDILFSLQHFVFLMIYCLFLFYVHWYFACIYACLKVLNSLELELTNSYELPHGSCGRASSALNC